MSESHSTHGKERNADSILVENLKGKGYSEDLGVEGMIILEWILEK